MSAKATKIAVIIVTVILAIVIAWTLATQNYIVMIIAIVLASGIAYTLQKSVKEVICDERTSLISDKAAAATFRFGVPVMGVGSVIIMALKDHLPVDMVSAAYTLSYCACALLLVNMAFDSYYNRKH